jgi:prevent-host-death family protein
MKAVTIGELRDRLSTYLAAVRRGERVIVLKRRTPIAEIGPIASAGSATESVRHELIRRGVIIPAAKPALARRRLGKPVPCRGDALAALRVDRDAD